MEFWQNRNVFVTGATGLLGGWLVYELLNRGAKVTVLVRDKNSDCMLFRDALDKRVNIVYGDLSSLSLLRRVIAEYEIQDVFHLAAQAIVGVAKHDPVGTLEANVQGTWCVLEAARQNFGTQVILASSDKAYGSSNNLPYKETHPLQGKYPYDVSKSCADLIGTMYATSYNVPVAITRCGNLFGGNDLNFSRTIPGVIDATLKEERFQIRSDGQYVRDFLYVEDAVDGYLCLAQKLAEDPSISGEAFNFSLGLKLTVLDVVAKVLEFMGRIDIEPEILNQASSEIREQYLSADYARECLSWKPRFGMDEGLHRTIEWYTKFLSK